MKRQELQERVRKVYESFDLGDLSAYRAAFADGIVWHVPGDNPVSGVYRGAEAYFVTVPGRTSPLDDWRFTVGTIEVNEGDNAALVAVHLTGSRRGKRIDMDGHHLIRLDDDGLVVEGWGFVQDQAALDEFFSA